MADSKTSNPASSNLSPWDVFDALPEGLAILDEAGTIRYLNTAWQELFANDGSPGFMIGADFLASCKAVIASDSESVAALATGMSEVLSGKAPRFDLDYLGTAGGRRRWLSATVVRFAGNGAPGLLVQQRDVTHSKQLEEEQRRNEHQLRLLFDHSPDAIFVEDLQGNVLDVNEAACRLHNTTRERLVGKNVLDLIPAEMREEVSRNFAKETTGELDYIESLSWTEDGRAVPVEIRSRPVDYNGQPAVLLHVRDITARRNAEEQLRKSEERYRSLLNNLPIGVYRTTPEGEIITVNQAFLQMMGFQTFEEFLQRGPAHTVYASPNDRTRFKEQIERNGFIQDMESVWVHRDGRHIYVQESARVIYDEHGRPAFYEGVVEDISERKRAEEERARLQEEIILVQAEMLAELSTPLIPISDQVVVMPLIGSVDSRRAQRVMETLLHGVASSGAEIVILDITGVPLVDTLVANAMIDAARAVHLLGAEVILTGIRSEVAQTIVGIGLDLSSITTLATVQSGIAYALQRTTRQGKRVYNHARGT
ncbi:MAG: hypothetical protein KatS3mg057_1597 [Herpetosiphonaceae bacterium]|nr:MAG: hypothetical protein KatS3mg057_1597 [Herpetosiphonaceae bacterium]